MGGLVFDHYVLDNGSHDDTQKWLKTQEFHHLHLSLDNKGQCIASNLLLDAIRDSHIEYDFIIRYDNDIIPQTPGFLAELIKASRLLSPTAVVSPAIGGLLEPPPAFGEKELGGYSFGFVEMLGGACRVMPVATLEGFRFTEHGQLSQGEALKFSAHCMEHKFPMAYVSGITVLHDTAAHRRDNAEYFERRRIEDYIPYGL
jgi:glycosyltransferase involved in cell wall biosynthesis